MRQMKGFWKSDATFRLWSVPSSHVEGQALPSTLLLPSESMAEVEGKRKEKAG